MGLPEQQVEEILSWSHVEAVAASAGADIFRPRYDCGIDGTFREIQQRGRQYLPSQFPLDFQLKASKRCILENSCVVYDLEVRAYNHLVERNNRITNPRFPPCLLLLKTLPREAPWLKPLEEGVFLAGLCYWHLLKGEPTQNRGTVRIRIPRTQRFVSEALGELLRRTAAGGWL